MCDSRPILGLPFASTLDFAPDAKAVFGCMELSLGIGIEAPKGQFRCLVVLGIRAWNSGPIPSSPPRAPNLRVAQFRGLELRIASNWFTSLRSAPLASPRPHRRFLHRRRPPPTSPPPPPAASPPPHLSPPPSSRARARSSQFPNHRCAVSYLLPCLLLPRRRGGWCSCGGGRRPPSSSPSSKGGGAMGDCAALTDADTCLDALSAAASPLAGPLLRRRPPPHPWPALSGAASPLASPLRRRRPPSVRRRGIARRPWQGDGVAQASGGGSASGGREGARPAMARPDGPGWAAGARCGGALGRGAGSAAARTQRFGFFLA